MDYNCLDLRNKATTSQTISTVKKPQRIILQGNECIEGIPEQAYRKRGFRIPTVHGNIIISPDDLATGTLLVGATGCGKTTFFLNLLEKIIPNMTNKDVMIIFDSKGDYKQKFYDPRNPKHIVISVGDKHKDIIKGWNVFGELTDSQGRFGEDTELFANEISKALFNGMESSTQPFFNLSSEDIFAKILLSFISEAVSTGDFSKLNNEEVCKFLCSLSNEKLLNFTGTHDDFKYLKMYVGNGTSTQALGVYAYLSAMRSRSLISSFRYKQSAGEFSMRKLIREKGGKVVFLEFDINYAETLECIYSLFYDLAIKEALSLSDEGSNTYFICDEMNLIPHVTRFEELLNFGRSKGCKTLIGLQSISQLNKNYGEDEANSILAGFLTGIFFNTVEIVSRDYVQKRFGSTLDLYNIGGNNNIINGYTVFESDLSRLRVGEAFIDMKGVPPFKTRFVKNI